jgi:hypothetical protein
MSYGSRATCRVILRARERAMTRTVFAAALPLSAAAPACAETPKVEAGAGAQTKLQEALILAKPGDTVELEVARIRVPTLV